MNIPKNEGLYLAILIILCGGTLLAACNPREFPGVKSLVIENEKRSTKNTEQAIKESVELQDLEGVCREVPIPRDFTFVWRATDRNKQSLLSSYYHSDTPYGEARRIWVDYFAANNWELKVSDASYPQKIRANRGTYEVVISHGGMGERTNYAIDCKKLK